MTSLNDNFKSTREKAQLTDTLRAEVKVPQEGYTVIEINDPENAKGNLDLINAEKAANFCEFRLHAVETTVPRGKDVVMEAFGIRWIVLVYRRQLLTGESLLIHRFPWV